MDNSQKVDKNIMSFVRIFYALAGYMLLQKQTILFSLQYYKYSGQLLYEQQGKEGTKQVAAKWAKRKPAEDQPSDSTTAINFKTHQVSESQAEIIIPKQYSELLKHVNQILVIECGREKVLVQVSLAGKDNRNGEEKGEISVLKSVLDLHGVVCGATGMFKGEIRVLQQAKISQYSLEVVQLLVKVKIVKRRYRLNKKGTRYKSQDTYFSRRDQYKVMKALKQSLTHVWIKKTLTFDEIDLEVSCMMQNNQTVVRSGIIDKNTHLIFRTNCSKLTFAIELSIETFQLNQRKELYLQKMIEFLHVYFHRNVYFNNQHRLSILFYARLFYPQFSTLDDAYNYLLKQNSAVTNKDKFEINFAVALQKDHRGRIYQDVYRRILWSDDMIDNFRQFIWEKVSEFIFTINWDMRDQANHVGCFISKSLQHKVHEKTIEQMLPFGTDLLRIKPFVHKLKATLAKSKNSNFFESISLLSEQYKHHYKFRSLTETGNAIITLSAGTSCYQVDQITYKMAKSYVCLTNIYCSFINFSRKTEHSLNVEIIYLRRNPIYGPNDKRKLQNLSLNCIEKQVYNSPMNDSTIIWDNFQNKNLIFPDQLEQVPQAQNQLLKQIHHCNIDTHFQLQESIVKDELILKCKYKDVSFINVYTTSEKLLLVHQILYEKMVIPGFSGVGIKQGRHIISDLDVFDKDLERIITNKKHWGIESANKQIQQYYNQYEQFLGGGIKNHKEDCLHKVQKLNNLLFNAQNEIQQEKIADARHQTMSNENIKTFSEQNFSWSEKKMRKNSDFYHVESQSVEIDQGELGKVNIFQVTYRNKNHEYNARRDQKSKSKKNVTHNKERGRNNMLDSNIHYLMPSFGQPILRKFKAFIRKQYIEEFKDEDKSIGQLFQIEKIWKNLCFPLLTPIYTKYRSCFIDSEEHLDTGVTDETNDKKISILQDQICKLLMKNYQIQQSSNVYTCQNLVTVRLSKGHVSCDLKMNGNNLARSYIIDKHRQNKVVPFLLYRYLCYEDKDYRFCAKFVYFEDKNFYNRSKVQHLETKTVKIVLAHDDGNNFNFQDFITSFSANPSLMRRQSQAIFSSSFNINRKDPMVEFIKMFNDKYKQIQVDLVKINQKQVPKKKKLVLNLKKQNRIFYHHEQIQVEVDTGYNLRSLFEILVSWNLCSSVLVSQFVENVMTLGRRSKLKPFLVSTGNIFHTVWSITTLGQIIFEHRISMQMLQKTILEAGEWLWDSNDYYMNLSGIAFIQFKKDKNLILWRDNNHEKINRGIKMADSNKRYNEFFIRSAVFDFLGAMIVQVVEEVQSKKILQ